VIDIGAHVLYTVGMYIRQISRLNKNGSRVRYLQLAHKVRDPVTGKPHDRVLHHLGREDQIDREQLKRLIASISRFLSPEDQVRVLAELRGVGAGLSIERSLPYGGSYVLDALWRRLELDRSLQSLLRERSFAIDVERLLFALVANRALDPRSKLGVERWVGRRVAIDGLDRVQVHTLYRAMDFLIEHDEAIQERVFFSTATLLNLEVDLLFFDTTTTYFETEEEDEGEDGLRRYGRPSKDHRPELPQVVIGLAVTRGGLPVRCWAWPPDTADASVVDEVQRDMAGWRMSRVVWVMDRGMAGARQRQALQRGAGQAIIGERLRSDEKVIAEALSRPGRFQVVRDNLEVKEVVVEEGSLKRRFVVVRNPDQAVRDREVREAQLKRLEEEIARLNAQRAKRRSAPKTYTRAVCALKSDPALGRYVRELKSGQLRIDRAAVRKEEKLDGKFLLSTTDPSLSAEDIALAYKQLAEVERAFRTLKHTLELRPFNHRLPERIRAHVLLCWLALLLVRVIETETGSTWERLRDELEQIHRVDLRTKDGVVRMVTELGADQRKTIKTLGIPPPRKMQKISLATAQA
jgi:transposase